MMATLQSLFPRNISLFKVALAGGAALALARLLASITRKAKMTQDGALSERGATLIQGEGPPCYIIEHILRLSEAYCPTERPDGYICLAISENKLAQPLFREELARARPDCISSTGYDNPRGGLRFRHAVAEFLSEHVAQRPVHPDAIASAAGATGVLHNLLFVLADAGDVCLIPAPYITGFDGDLTDARVGLVPFAVPCPSLTDMDAGISPASLDAALKAAERERGSGRVRLLLLTSPHNPTGLLYSEDSIRGAIGYP